jgi:transposase, IS5 family
LPLRFKKLLKSRPAIEPIIGHMKNDHRLGRHYLLGRLGDKINAVLSGRAFNLNKILNYLKIEQTCFAWGIFQAGLHSPT